MKDFIGRHGRIQLHRLLSLGALGGVLGVATLTAIALRVEGQITSPTPLFLLFLLLAATSVVVAAWLAGLMYGLLPTLFRLSLTIAAGFLPKLFTASLGVLSIGAIATSALWLYGPPTSFLVVAAPLLIASALACLTALALVVSFRRWFAEQEALRRSTLACYERFKVGKRPEELTRIEAYLRAEYGTTTASPIATTLDKRKVDPADIMKIRELEDAHQIVGAINPYQEPKRPPCFPGLEQRPWFDTADFPWIQKMEALAAGMRSEALEAFELSEFKPYDYPGVGNKGWQFFWFKKAEETFDENLARCPVTAAALEHMPQGDGDIAFALLAPGTGLAQHRDCGTILLALHLALVVPEKCTIRVGGETKTWQEGKGLVFDPSYEHKVMNASDRPRIILLADFNHPGMTELENDFFVAVAAKS